MLKTFFLKRLARAVARWYAKKKLRKLLRRLFPFLFIALLIPSIAAAQEVKADLSYVHDGDTFRAIAHPWPTIQVNTLVRVKGIDTPELRGKCEKEKALAREAKEALEVLLTNTPIVLHDPQPDKYFGRIVAYVTADGLNVASLLIDDGYARPYYGGTRKSWCD